MLSLFRASQPRRFALKRVPGVNAPPEGSSTGSEAPDSEKKSIPFIPREFAKDTIDFFRQNSPHIKSLLDLVFSAPGFSNDKEPVPETPRMKRAKKQYLEELETVRKLYAKQEEKARVSMFNAIKNLPADMYDEAIGKGEMLPPESLQFHEMYKDQIMRDHLSDHELMKLQTFSNLMHIRYSHSEAKKKHKEKFFMTESAALNLRKERAKAEKG